MIGRSPRKQVDALYWEERRRVARTYRDAAQQAMELAEAGQDCNPVISQIVLAAIAYADSITAKRARFVNQQDHAQASRLLREVMSNLLPDSQERRYRRILGLKDEVQYGTRHVGREEALRLLRELEEFARWAEDVLS